MKFTNLAIATTFLAPSRSANIRSEDHDLKPYLHHNLRNLRNHKGGMDTDSTPVDLEQFPQWATEEGYW
jgi:hypothetical protein